MNESLLESILYWNIPMKVVNLTGLTELTLLSWTLCFAYSNMMASFNSFFIFNPVVFAE